MRHKLNEAYFLTMAKLFGGILLGICIVTAAVGIWGGAMSEHTPTPWREWDVMRTLGKDQYPKPHIGDIRLAGSNDLCVGVLFGGYASLPECDANASFIVKAVNNHDALVKALEAAREYLESDVADGFRPAERLTAEIDQVLGVVGKARE